MAHSDSDDEGEVIDDLDFDLRSSEAGDADDDDIIEDEGEADERTEGDEESVSEDSDEDADEDEEEEEDGADISATQERVAEPARQPALTIKPQSQPEIKPQKLPSPQRRERSLSPACARRSKLVHAVKKPRSYTVEAICAIAHPVPTHALASSMCMSHLLTGSEDGYIRDYDIFAAVNGKNFLTAPQRSHCNVVEGTMKPGHLRTWWENPADMGPIPGPSDETASSPVYSLLSHSDALWALAGTQHGHINLFTVRHDPGRFITALRGHRGPVSSLSMQYDEKGFFSAGWDGDTLQWDLNTGNIVRKFYSHGAQVAIVAVRPLSTWSPPPVNSSRNGMDLTGGVDTVMARTNEDDAKSDASFDPLFDDEPEEGENTPVGTQASNGSQVNTKPHSQPAIGEGSSNNRSAKSTISKSTFVNPRGPPTLDPATYADFSPDVLLTASIDGQIVLWDRRVNTPEKGVGRLEMSDKTPPWCVSACWSTDGGQVYAGRRTGTVDVWDTRQFGRSGGGTPKLLKTLRNPVSSGAVSCVVAFPDGHHIACASNDNIRLWNAGESGDPESTAKVRSGVQFKIIPGHHGGQVSQMVVDPGSRFMVSASSNRGWHGDSTKTILVHDIKHVL